jgi:predicted MFS family arabinose efflux permease
MNDGPGPATASNAASDVGKITRPVEIVALALLGMIGNIAAYALPVNVGALVDSMKLAPRMAGFIGTAELVGLAAGSVAFSALILRVGWRRFALAGLIMTVIGNLITPYIGWVPLLMVVRALSGLGGGMLLSMAAAGLASTRQPERVLGAAAIASMLFSGAILYSFPLIAAHWGAPMLFFTIAGINVAAMAMLPGVPERSPYIGDGKNISPAQPDNEPISMAQFGTAPIGIAISTLSGIFLFFTAAMGFWVFFERAGVAAKFSTQVISTALGSSQLVGAVGAIAAATIATRLGNRMIPVGVSILLAAAAAVAMVMPLTSLTYALAAYAFIFGWAFLYPYLMGIGISLDPSARLVSYSLVLQTAGKAIGPTLAAMLVVGTNFVPVYWMALGLFLASLGCLVPAVLYTDKALRLSKRTS